VTARDHSRTVAVRLRILEARMSAASELQLEAHRIAEELRRCRAGTARAYGADLSPVRALEAQLAALWAAVRAARVADRDPDHPIDLSLRRTRPKWE
jgi:hypothetical protein